MDEAWERAVEAALKGQPPDSPLSLTLDGAVKPPSLAGRLPSPSVFERRPTIELLSASNLRLASLHGFPRLPNLRRLILSDNRIAGGLRSLVDAGLAKLRDLDLSNNRIARVEDLEPLAELKLESLDLYECPVTRVKDYRARVFGIVGSLKYLDSVDAEGNERPESDEDDEDEDEDEEEGDEENGGEEDGEEEEEEEGEDDEEDGDGDEEGDEENGEGEDDEVLLVCFGI